MHLQCKLGEKMGYSDRKKWSTWLESNKQNTNTSKKQDDDDYYNCIKVSKERKSKKVILKSQLALQIVKMCIKVMLMCFSVVCFIFVFAPRFNVPLGKISWIGYYSALLTQFFSRLSIHSRMYIYDNSCYVFWYWCRCRCWSFHLEFPEKVLDCFWDWIGT